MMMMKMKMKRMGFIFIDSFCKLSLDWFWRFNLRTNYYPNRGWVVLNWGIVLYWLLLLFYIWYDEMKHLQLWGSAFFKEWMNNEVCLSVFSVACSFLHHPAKALVCDGIFLLSTISFHFPFFLHIVYELEISVWHCFITCLSWVLNMIYFVVCSLCCLLCCVCVAS